MIFHEFNPLRCTMVSGLHVHNIHTSLFQTYDDGHVFYTSNMKLRNVRSVRLYFVPLHASISPKQARKNNFQEGEGGSGPGGEVGCRDHPPSGSARV